MKKIHTNVYLNGKKAGCFWLEYHPSMEDSFGFRFDMAAVTETHSHSFRYVLRRSRRAVMIMFIDANWKHPKAVKR